MGFFIFTDNEDVRNMFANSPAHPGVFFFQAGDLKKTLKRLGDDSLVYLDVSSFDKKTLDKTLQSLSGRQRCRYGFIDPVGSVRDPAALFHRGAVDYLGPTLTRNGVSLERLEAAASYSGVRITKASGSRTQGHAGTTPSGLDWGEIKQGQEYTFFLMYAELDRYLQLKDRQADSQVSKLISVYRTYLESEVSPAGGRLWIWNEPGGLFLFPYDGESYQPVMTCIRLMLNKKIFNVEMIGSTIFYSYRIALHAGKTVFRRRGDTEQIVSEAVNYIYHMGQRFTEKGNLCITEDAARVLPRSLQEVFLPVGSFEGKKILKFNLPRNL